MLGGAMLCISCRNDMRVVRIEQDRAMDSAGYEHQTLECVACRKTERRLAFTGEKMAWPGYWHALLALGSEFGSRGTAEGASEIFQRLTPQRRINVNAGVP